LTRKLLCLLLAVLLLIGATGTAFAADGDGQTSAPYEIPIGETDVANRNPPHVFNNWLISGAEVVSCEVEIGLQVGFETGLERYNKTFNITLAADTALDAPVNIFFDVTKGSGNYMLVTTVMSTTSAIILQNYNQLLIADPQGLNFELVGGEASQTLYIYYAAPNYSGLVVTENVFNFTIADPDASGDPDPEDVASIAVTAPPNKTTYFDGGRFDRTGMVVTATLTDDSTVPINGYTVTPDPLTLGTEYVTVTFGEGEHIFTATQAITVLPCMTLGNVTITNGQFMDDINYNGYGVYTWKVNAFDAVVLYGQAKANITFEVGEGVDVYIGSEQQTVTDGVCTLQLDTSRSGTASVITLRLDGAADVDYTFTCYTQEYSGMPSRVDDYFCVASQYTNGSALGAYGLNPVKTLLGTYLDSVMGNMNYGPISLGNFGGYITYYYETPITDDPRNPYGIDFIVYGNSYDGSSEFAEPGNVLVSEDGDTWYTLAGSLHYDDNALWNYSMTYTRTQNGRAAWAGSDGKSGEGDTYPRPEYYPLFPWTEETKSQITLTGTLLVPESELNEYGNTVPPYPYFGYADCGVVGTSNAAANPYLVVYYDSWGTRLYTGRTDGFDLKWAVDENGRPVDLSSAQIQYVKVQTASNISNGGIGEKSTEINGVRVAQPSGSNVGMTDAPSAITVDGQAVQLVDGVYEYDLTTSGLFQVTVDAAEGANVFINGARTTAATFGKVPGHGMLRIIVQEGEKEPQIYYLTLTDDGSGEPYTTVTFDANGGRVEGLTSITRYYDADTQDKVFPIPVRESYTFLGWYWEEESCSEYTTDMPAELTLTASWRYDGPAIEGQVRVIVENTTFTEAVDGVEPAWTGVLADAWVDIDEESSMISCVVAALDTVQANVVGAEGGYISSINGLAEFDGGQGGGWMGALNDWFTSTGFGGITVVSGTLEAGDEIRIMYTTNYGADLGGSWDNNDKTLKAITFSAGALSPAFDQDTHEYTLTVPEGTGGVIVTPTATNKFFQVRSYLDSQPSGTEYKRTATIPVSDGAVISVVCGDPAWPSMNNGPYPGNNAESVPAETYAITVQFAEELGAGYTVGLTTTDSDKNPGDTVTVDLSVDGAAGSYAALQTVVGYDQSRVSYTNSSFGDAFTVTDNPDSGKLLIIRVGDTTSAGSQGSLSFTVKNGIPAGSGEAVFTVLSALVGVSGDPSDPPAAAAGDDASVSLHNLTVTFTAGPNVTMDSVTAYARYGLPGLYTDNSYATTFTEPVPTADSGCVLASPVWHDGSAQVAYDTIAATAFTANAIYTATATQDLGVNITLPQQVTVISGVTDGKASYGADVVFSVTPGPGQEVKSVTYTVGTGSPVTLIASEGEYTIPGTELTADVVVTVIEQPSGTVEFISFDDYKGAPTGFKVLKFDGSAPAGYKFQYNGADMYYSEKYQLYVCFAAADVTAETALGAITCVAGTAPAVNYDGNVNQSGAGLVSIIDAQLVYDLYTGVYLSDTAFGTISQLVRLAADMDSNGCTDTTDVQIIVSLVQNQEG